MLTATGARTVTTTGILRIMTTDPKLLTLVQWLSPAYPIGSFAWSHGIEAAIGRIRSRIPYPITIEVETESLDQVKEAIDYGADIIMLDNMSVDNMRTAVEAIRKASARIKIEASGNISLRTIRGVAETGVDYISSSAPITRSPWLDLSMRMR